MTSASKRKANDPNGLLDIPVFLRRKAPKKSVFEIVTAPKQAAFTLHPRIEKTVPPSPEEIAVLTALGWRPEQIARLTPKEIAVYVADRLPPTCRFAEQLTLNDRRTLKGEGVMAKKAKVTKKAATKSATAKPKGAPRSAFAQDAKITVKAKENPKRVGSAAHKRFGVYKTGMTVGEFLTKGGTGADLHYDTAHDYISITGGTAVTRAPMKKGAERAAPAKPGAKKSGVSSGASKAELDKMRNDARNKVAAASAPPSN